MTKAQMQQRDEAIARLREVINPGDTIHTILRHVSRSGMLRVIDLVKISPTGEALHIGYNAALAMNDRYDRDKEGIRMGGCGMDMGFAAVYNLSRVLFRDGFECTGERCPSNDHSNGDRNHAPHKHSDPGYALKQRWL